MNNNVVAKHILDVAVGLEKKSKNELITELSDIFDNASKIDLNSKENIDSLKNLAKAFEAIFSKAGNKSIDFEDIIKMPPPAMFAEMGKIAATSFWDAWNSVSGSSKSDMSQDVLKKELDKLTKQREALVKRQKTLPKKQREYEDLSSVADDLPYMDKNEFEAFTKEEIKKLGGNIEKIAVSMQQALVDALDSLSDIKLDDPKYDAILEGTLKKARDVFRMSRTLEKHPNLVKDKSILEEYDFSYLQENYSSELENHSIRLSNLIRKVDEEIGKIPSQLKAIDDQIVQIKNRGIDIVDQASAKDGLKTLDEIQKAYKSILTTNNRHPQRPDKDKIKQIQSALNWEPSEEKGAPQIQTLFDQYQESAATGDWIKEYKALLKYVRLYEKYLQSENKTHRNKITRPDNPFTPLYERLKPMAENAQNMLQSILNMSEGKAPVGIGGTGKDESSAGPAPEDVANAQKIREEAEAKAKAEKEAREEAERRLLAEKQQEESLKRQRAEEEKIAKAQEKAATAREKELGLTRAMDKFQSEFDKTDKKNETLAFINTQTGDMSKLFIGDPHSVTMDPGTSRQMANLGFDMEVHSHAWETAAPSDTDFEEWFKQLSYIQKFGIRAGKELLAFDFSKLDKSQLVDIIDKYKSLGVQLREQALAMNPDEQKALFDEDPAKYQEWLQVGLRQGLEEIFKDIPGVMKSIQMPKLFESVDTSVSKKAPQTSSAEEGVKTEAEAHKQNTEAIKEEITAQEKLNDAQKQGVNVDDELRTTIALLEKEKLTYEDILLLVKEYNDESKMKELSKAGNWDEYDKIFAHHADIAKKLVPVNMMGMGSDSPDKWLATVGMSAETAAQRLKELYDRLHQVASFDDELVTTDEDDDLRRENGALEDKLELLQEISGRYGNTITQKQRDRYEELNQKDMNEGLTPREDERYWELGEQIEEADQALEEFGNTYDKIIVKLANGKNVEILPDDKGLRTLAKIDEEYGESYDGVEIDDVVFERVKQEAVATEQTVDGLNESLKKTQQLMSGGGTGDASLADLETERMKSESLQNELDNKIGALSAAYEEKEALQNDLESATDLNEKVSKELLYTKEDLAAAEQRANESEDRANKLSELLELPSGDSQSSANIEELRTLLTSIVYNTKIADDAESKYGSLALESTLQEVKNVLDSIDSKTVVDDSNGSSSGDAAGRKNPYLLSDANGKALTVYRGTRDSFGGFVANRTGTFGTDNLNIAKGYTHGDGKIFAYNAEMRNPLEIQAKGAQLKQIPNLGNAFEALSDPILKELRSLWSQITTLKEELKTASGFDKEVTIPNKIGALQKRIQEISEDESHVYGVGGTDLFARKAKKNGYDGVIFRDLVDPSSATPPSERVPSNIVVTFDEKQMHLLETFSVTGNEISKIDTQDDAVEHNEPQVVEVDDSKGASYALESTLQIVKGVLDNIQTNTSKIGTSETSNVDTIAGTALDGRLAEIKSVLESIDNKIAKGGAITTRGAVKQAAARHAESEAQTQATQSNMMKSLTHDYKTLGKLSAQFASDNNLETKAMLDNLKEEISRKRQSINLTMEENASLREKYSIAFDAEKRLLDAAMAQKEIDDKNKASAKEAETAWKKQVKDAKRATGINAANNAVNTGDQTVIRAIGTDGISKDIENKAKKLSNQIKALRMLRDEIDKKGNQASNADRNNLSKQIVKVKELKSEMDGYLKLHEKYSGEGVTDLGKANNFGAAGTTEYWNNITAAIKNAATGRVTIKGMNADTGELSGTTKIAANTFAQWSAVVDPLTGRLSMLRTGVKKTETLLESITRKTKEIFTYFSGSSIIFKAFNELKKGVQYVREIDVALTELKKVTDETEESYDRFLKTAAKTGERLGSTISAVTEATATFAKLGYTMEQSMEMAEAAIVYKNVGDNITSTEDAADSIISTLKGFGLEASQAMDIVDKFNEVGNRFAITSQGIGEALRLSASALSEGGNSLDESIAIITAANEVVNDPSSVGTALKTLTLRLRGAKTELEEMGEDVTGMATTTSQLQAKLLALTGGKVDIMLDENTFKNSTQILREMAAAWEDMNDIQRASALELMGGKRQANVLSALISNFDTVESAIEASANSSGSALKENERYLDSIQGKIDQFNNAVQTLWSNTLDSDVVKFLIDLATKIVKIVDEIGPLNIAIVGLVTFLEKKHGVFSNFFNPAGSGAQEVARQVDETFDAVKVKRQIGGKKGAITRRTKKLESEGKTFAEIQEDPKIKQWTQEIKDSEQAIDEYNASIQRADETLRQSNATTVQATATERAHTTAETAGVGATNASAAAEAADTAATTNHTAATWADVLAESNREGATIRSTAATASQVLATKLANSALIQNAINLKLATVEEVKNMSVTQLLALGFKGLAVSIWSAVKAIAAFLFTNPIGWIILVVAAVAGAVAAFIKWGNTAKNLREDLSNLKSEISDIKSDLESLNGELENTRERMAELLAKDSLTFTEQEELENLKKQNDELEREIELLELKEKRKQEAAQDTFDDLMDKNQNLGKTRDSDGDGEKEVYDKSLERKMGNYEDWSSEYEIAKQNLLNLQKNGGSKSEIKKAEKRVEKAEKKLEKWQGKVDEELDQYLEDADGIDYESADTQTRKYLDYIYNTEDRYNISSGGDQAKSAAIKRIFNKDNMSDAKKEIDSLVEQLAKKPGDATIIAEISKQCKAAEKDLAAVGLSVQEATNYFTQLGTNASFNTLEGKIAEMQTATSKLQTLLSDTKSSDFTGLFDDDGKVSEAAIAKYFQGTSEETRKEITKLVKDINDGKISVDTALKQFELFSIESSLNIYVSEVKTNFKEVFTELDEADGLIDTFEELGEAIGSTANALKVFNKAEAEMANSGRVSIETALQLMEYTDDYGSVLEVVDGKLKLVDNAEEVLIQTRIDAIKTSAEAGLTDAQLAYDKAKLATETYKAALETDMSASVVASAWEKVLAAGAGLLAGIKSLLTSESWSDAYNRVYNETLSEMTGYETSYSDAGLQALIDAENEAKDAVDAASDRVNLANQLTPDTLSSTYEADDVGSKEDVANNLFENEMNYWENRLAANQAKRDQVQNEIDLLESQGIRAGQEYYKELIALEQERKTMLEAQRDEAIEYLNTQEEGSEEWWNAAKIVNDLENEIDSATAAIQDYTDAQAQIKWDTLEEITSRFSDLHDEVSDLRDILQREDMFDGDGNWTESGAAVLGTYIYDLETYKNELAALQSEISDLQAHPYNEENAAYLKATYSIDSEQEYNDLVTQWNDKQREIVKGAYDTADAIKDAYSQQVDAIEDAINEQIDAYNDYIDVVKEAYDAERDLYEFKKDIQKQSRSIAETERRIASLSGSTNQADIAERRKLEAQLAEQKEGINDSYYSHANDQRSNALDSEAQAYEESMNRYVESLHETLEEYSNGLITFTETGAMVTNEFLNGVTATVMQNAGLILEKYEEVSPYMSNELKQPFIDANEQLGTYGNNLSVLNDWTSDSGYFGKFSTTASGQITTPFVNGTAAASAFQTSATNAMSAIADSVRSNVVNITTNLGSVQSAYSGIITSAQRAKAEIDAANAAAAASVLYTGSAGSTGSTGSAPVAPAQVDSRILSKYKVTSDQVMALGYGPISLEEFERLLEEYQIKYSSRYKQVHNTAADERLMKRVIYGEYTSGPLAIRQYAKGTTGTKRNQWAITDEPQFGDELVLIPTAQGNLSYMRKGTGVVPADLTANLMEWGQFTPDSMNLGGGVNVNMINNSVIKPQYDLSFDSLVHVDNCSQETLRDLEKMVDNKIDRFSKELNYSIKRFAR